MGSLDDFKIRLRKPQLWVCRGCHPGDLDELPPETFIKAYSPPQCQCGQQMTAIVKKKLKPFYCKPCFNVRFPDLSEEGLLPAKLTSEVIEFMNQPWAMEAPKCEKCGKRMIGANRINRLLGLD